MTAPQHGVILGGVQRADAWVTVAPVQALRAGEEAPRVLIGASVSGTFPGLERPRNANDKAPDPRLRRSGA
jgi:hypothetical protein